MNLETLLARLRDRHRELTTTIDILEGLTNSARLNGSHHAIAKALQMAKATGAPVQAGAVGTKTARVYAVLTDVPMKRGAIHDALHAPKDLPLQAISDALTKLIKKKLARRTEAGFVRGPKTEDVTP